MGRKWYGSKRGGGSSGQVKRVNPNSISSCRGHSIVIGTCDTARERESNKELVNLLTQGIEDLVQRGEIPEKYVSPFKARKEAESEANEVEGGTYGSNSYSIASLLAAELEEARDDGGGTACVHSILLNMKGVILVKLTRPDVDPLHLLRTIFDKIASTKLALSRHLIRLIPCARAFYPNYVELVSNVRTLLHKDLPGVSLPLMQLPVLPSLADEAEADEPVSKKARPESDVVTDASNDKKEPRKVSALEEKEGKTDGSDIPDRETVLALRAERKRLRQEKSAEELAELRAEQVRAMERAEATEALLKRRREEALARGDKSPPKLPPFTLEVALKLRNHNNLTKGDVTAWVRKNIPDAPAAKIVSKDADVSTTLPFTHPFTIFYPFCYLYPCRHLHCSIS